jgi:ParB family chromosome partitioning protein
VSTSHLTGAELVDLKVTMLRELAAANYPRGALGEIAHRHGVAFDDARDLVIKHGFPNADAMLRAANILGGQTTAAPKTPTPPSNEPTEVPAEHPVGRKIQLRQLDDHPANPPERVNDVAELTASIQQVGILQPLIVTPHPGKAGRWVILGGHRRAAAARAAGLRSVPCVIRSSAESDLTDQLVTMLIENVQRHDLNAMDKAEQFGRLRDEHSLSLNKLATRTGLAVGTVSYYLSLLDLDDETRDKVRTGEIQVTHAIAAVKKARRQARRSRGERQSGRPVVVEAEYFTLRHPLGRRVKETCTHTRRPVIGAAGCGQCWEDAIRRDAATPEELGA